MVTIDWDAAAVRAIIGCLDGQQAWEMLLAYVAPYRGQRIELRDAIWAERQKVMPRRGGRSRPRRGLLHAAPATSSRDEVSKPAQPELLRGHDRPSASDLATFEEIRKELTRREPRQIIYRPAAAAGRAPEEQRPTHPLRWQGGLNRSPGRSAHSAWAVTGGAPGRWVGAGAVILRRRVGA